MYETFAHTADIGIRGIGKSYEKAFIEAAKCLFSVMADLTGFIKEIKITIDCTAYDRDELFLDFMNRLIYQAAVNRCIFIDFEITKMTKNSLTVTAHGEKIKTNHKNIILTEVKAATLSELKVYQKKDQFIAQCIVDI